MIILISLICIFIGSTYELLQGRLSSDQGSNIKLLSVFDLPSSEYHNYLSNENGRALYIDSKAEAGVSSCYGECAMLFLPVLIRVNQSIALSDQLDENKVGYIKRNDESEQATYNNYALFYFRSDEDKGDTWGQAFNNTWFILDMKGNPIRKARNETELHDEEAGRSSLRHSNRTDTELD
jgi:predicted lipoprotein with Yx(FWY)xxD motif